MAVWNYTGRRDIDRRLVTVAVEDGASPLKVYLRADPSLKSDPAYAGCSVVLEAHLRTRAERADLGPLAALASSVEVVFPEFLLPDDVGFALKIVNPSDRRIAGVLENIRGRGERDRREDGPRKRKSLLPVNMASDADNLKDRFWAVSFATASHPTLLLNRRKFRSLGDANGDAFRALAFPAVLREVLSYAYVVQFSAPPTWRDDWAALVRNLTGEEPPDDPDPGDPRALGEYFENVSAWIDAACARFSQDCRLGRIAGPDENFRRS